VPLGPAPRHRKPSALRLPLRAQPQPHAQRARLAAPVAATAPAASTASPESPAAGKPTVLVAEKLGAAGLALLRDSEMEIDALLARADHALYAAKARGRDRVEIADSDRSQAWQPGIPLPRPPSLQEPVLVSPSLVPDERVRSKVGIH